MHKCIVSMLAVFKHLFKRPVTLEYPEKKYPTYKFFRGKPTIENCASCYCCLKVCPSGAISFTENKIKFDLKKCIFCGNCSYYCPKGAIKMSGEYELATLDKNDLELEYEIKKEDGNERS